MRKLSDDGLVSRDPHGRGHNTADAAKRWDCEHRVYRFDNGLGASVVQGTVTPHIGLGSAPVHGDGPYELAVIEWDKHRAFWQRTVETPITDGVERGTVTRINALLRDIKAL